MLILHINNLSHIGDYVLYTDRLPMLWSGWFEGPKYLPWDAMLGPSTARLPGCCRTASVRGNHVC